jgi:four helix bundle protein
MQDFHQLKAWEKEHAVVLEIYRATKRFPKEEIYGGTSQLRRSAASVPTTIAEGCGRGTQKELAQFLQVAMGSASEVEYLLVLAKNLNYLEEKSYNQFYENILAIKKMLASLVLKPRTEH